MYYFLHIPKCGGNTIKELFFEAFDFKNCVKVWTDFEADTDVKGFADLSVEFLSTKKAIVGHLSFQDLLKNPYMASLNENGYIRSVTVVRDPIDRIISLRNYMCANTDHWDRKRAVTVDPVKFLFQEGANFQTWFLSKVNGESVASIAHRIECFKLEDSEEKVRIWLENETQKSLRSIEPVNVTKKEFPDFIPFRKSELSDTELNALRLKHADDFSLYELAK